MRRKRCHCCRSLYLPDPRTYRQQKTCAKESCRTLRKRQAVQNWWKEHPLYGASRTVKQKQWRAKHGGYWKGWRKEHAGYVNRNRKAQKLRNARNRGWIAKQNEWKAVCIDKLERIRHLRLIAKQNEIGEVSGLQIDGLCRYLKGQLMIAKQNDMDARK